MHDRPTTFQSLLSADPRLPLLALLVALVGGALVFANVEHGLGYVVWGVALSLVLAQARTDVLTDRRLGRPSAWGRSGLGKPVEALLSAGRNLPLLQILAAAAFGAVVFFHVEHGLGDDIWVLGGCVALNQVRSEIRTAQLGDGAATRGEESESRSAVLTS